MSPHGKPPSWPPKYLFQLKFCFLLIEKVSFLKEYKNRKWVKESFTHIILKEKLLTLAEILYISLRMCFVSPYQTSHENITELLYMSCLKVQLKIKILLKIDNLNI